MLLNKYGQKIKTLNGTFFVGQRVVANKESTYNGLHGTIVEIRTNADKETENPGVDIIVNFQEPQSEGKRRKLYSLIGDTSLDLVVMAPSTIEPDRSRVTCPDCGAQLVPDSGCFYCPWCGFSYCK